LRKFVLFFGNNLANFWYYKIEKKFLKISAYNAIANWDFLAQFQKFLHNDSFALPHIVAHIKKHNLT